MSLERTKVERRGGEQPWDLEREHSGGGGEGGRSQGTRQAQGF